MAIGDPVSSSSPVSTTVMSAFLSVPACCMARSAATITTIPPLSSPAPGPTPSLPLRSHRWNGLSGSNTVSRCPISSIFLPRPLPLWRAMMCPARPAAFMSTHSTAKPSASNSGRTIRPTASTPARLSDPLFWLTSFSSSASERPCSASTVAIIRRSAGEGAANAGEERARVATKARLDKMFMAPA